MRNWPHLDRDAAKIREGEPVQMSGLVTRAEGDSRRIVFRASNSSADRHRTKIKSEGLDTTNYEKNPVFLWGHDGYGGFFSVPNMDNVLGRVASFKKNTDSFDIDVDFAPEDVNPKAEQALRMVRSRFLNAVSIGFIPREIVRNLQDENDIPTITKAELLEVSLVPIPSNPDALALSRSMMDYDLRSGARAQMGWICRHGQFYANPTQAEQCHGHDPDHEPPDNSADIGNVVLDAFQQVTIENEMRRGIRAALIG